MFLIRERYQRLLLADWTLPLAKAKSSGKPEENEGKSINIPFQRTLPLAKAKSMGKPMQNEVGKAINIPLPADWTLPSMAKKIGHDVNSDKICSASLAKHGKKEQE